MNIFNETLQDPLTPVDILGDVSFPIAVTLIASALGTLSDGLTSFESEYPDQGSMEDGKTSDYIIVGAGTAGGILSNRLTEGDCTVLAIEAGGKPTIPSEVPGLFVLTLDSQQDWRFDTQPTGNQRAQKDDFVLARRGKILGGDSGINFLFYFRGRTPCDDWHLSDWDYDVCLKYYKKLENLDIPIIRNSSYAKYHGFDGPVSIASHDNDEDTSLSNDILQLYKDIGYNVSIDSDDPFELTFALQKFIINKKERRRSGTAQSYVRQLKNRENFEILYNTQATKILIRNNTAIGVEVKGADGEKYKLYAKKEVILSAGSINSAKLLMLSGIGPKEHLERLCIDLIADLPVGQNMKDMVYVPLFITGAKANALTLEQAIAGLNIFNFPYPVTVGEINLNGDNTKADIELVTIRFGAGSVLIYYFCNVILNYKLGVCNSIIAANIIQELFLLLVILKSPKSSGTITLNSTDPTEDPVINTGYFTSGDDLDRFVEGIKRAIAITQAKYLKEANSEVVQVKLTDCEAFEFGTDAYWNCYALQMSLSFFQMIGTCAMGPVSHSNFCVKGVDNLRVVDGGSLPNETSGMTMSAVMMAAERASDIIKEGPCGCRDKEKDTGRK